MAITTGTLRYNEQGAMRRNKREDLQSSHYYRNRTRASRRLLALGSLVIVQAVGGSLCEQVPSSMRGRKIKRL